MPDIRDPKLTTSTLELLTSGPMDAVASYLLARTEPLGEELTKAILYNLCNEICRLQQQKADKR